MATIVRVGIVCLLWGMFTGVPVAADGKVQPRLRDADTIAFIRTELQAQWAQYEVRPSPRADDATWCRRVFLDLLGRVPTIAELQAFLKDRLSDRRERLVDTLLGNRPDSTTNDRYLEAYADQWATILANAWLGRPHAPMPGVTPELANRTEFYHYLKRQLVENRPYDKLVYDLIAAVGSTSPGESDFNPATNYLVDKIGTKATEAVNRTMGDFLALNVQCAECHNDPFSDFRMAKYWSLQTFFAQAKVESKRTGATRLVDVDYQGEYTRDLKSAESFFHFTGCFLSTWVVYPQFIDGTKINPSGRVAEVHRRTELARLVTKSPRLSAAIVDRVWSRLLGATLAPSCYGQLIPEGYEQSPSSYPLLQGLSQDFVASGHDLKRLIRWVVLSEPYALSSQVIPQNAKDPHIVGRPLFSRFAPRLLDPEQVYGSLVTVRTQRPTLDASRSAYHQRLDAVAQFTQSLNNDEGEKVTHFAGTRQQALFLFNGPLTEACLQRERDTLLGQLEQSARSTTDVIDGLFQATLGRRPSTKELQQLAALARVPSVSAWHEDVLWSLVNSSEFLSIH